MEPTEWGLLGVAVGSGVLAVWALARAGRAFETIHARDEAFASWLEMKIPLIDGVKGCQERLGKIEELDISRRLRDVEVKLRSLDDEVEEAGRRWEKEWEVVKERMSVPKGHRMRTLAELDNALVLERRRVDLLSTRFAAIRSAFIGDESSGT